MALTGTPLLVLSIVATLGAIASTVLCWRRGGRLRVLTRTVGVLLCEALTLFTAGAAINDALDGLYPSWSTLFQPDAAPSPTVVAAGPDTSLELWLRGHTPDAGKKGLVFDWKPRELATWHLSATPTVYVPPAYFTEPDLRFPVIVLVAPGAAGSGQSGWDSATVAGLVAESSADPVSAILVFVRADRPDAARTLQQDLPARLDLDIRVNDRGWAVVGVSGDAEVALNVLAGAPQRFRSAAVVAGVSGTLDVPIVAQAHRSRVDQAVLVMAGASSPGDSGGQGGGGLVGPDPASSGPTDGAGEVDTVSVTQPNQRLAVALRWEYQQVSAPLVDPVGGPVAVPTPTGRR